MGVKLAAASGGSVELVPTNTASNYTITMPASTGTVLTTTSPKTGNVLQVVSTTILGMQDISSTAFVDVSGMSVSITPTATSSKIFIQVAMYYSNAFYPGFRVDRNGTTVVQGNASGLATQTSFAGFDCGSGSPVNQYRPLPLTFTYLDSPSSTSALTYKITCSTGRTTASTIRINGAYTIGDANQMTTTSTITVWEIAG